MKKIMAMLLAALMALTLCACPALEQPASGRPQVHIKVGKVTTGMVAKDVFVEVTIDNQPVACRVQMTGFAWDGYWDMEEDEPVPEEPFAVRVDIFYSLPKGCDVEDVDITMDCDGGNYDGTGSISNDNEGNIEAWSRAFYGKEPLPPETEPTEASTQPTEAPTQPTEAPTQPTEAPTQPAHTHTWVEQPGPGILFCTIDGAKTFKCSCGETEIIPAPGHELGPWSVTEPTCTKDGSKVASCKRCPAGFVVELPATGHNWSAWVKKNGRVHSRTCSVCGEEEEADHNIPAGSVTCTDCGQDIIN